MSKAGLSTLLSVCLLAVPSPEAPAQTRDAVRAAFRAAGAYVAATALVEESARSTCGYALVLTQPGDFDAAAVANEVIAAFPSTVREELFAANLLARSRQRVREMFEEAMKDMERAVAKGLDAKTACGLLVGVNMGLLGGARNEWHRARATLAR